MIWVKLLITASIFLGVYGFLNKLTKSEKEMIKEIKELNNFEIEGGSYSKKLKKKISIKIPINVTQEELDKLGNLFPFKVNPFIYMGMKIILMILVFVSTLARFNNIGIATIVSPLGFIALDYMYKRSNKNDRDLLRLDLADVYDSIIFNVRSGETLGLALADVYTVARRSERLREALLRLSAKINMTANVEEALEDFKNKFTFIETDLFVHALKQALETGLVENVLEGQSMQIKRKNIDYLKIRNSKIEGQVVILGMLVFFGTVTLIFLVLGADVGSGMGKIFT